MKIRGTATNKLADVIQTLLLVRKTGLLTVQRDGPGDSFEQGSISLYSGQVIDAEVGALRGPDAYKKLTTWTTCHFVFQAMSPPPGMTPPPASFSAPDTQGNPRIPPQPQPGFNRNTSGTYALASVVPSRIPFYQGGNLPDFQRLGLSRTHRQLFLLIDGKRPIQDLIRLIGRQPQEVLALLVDLEKAGLIQQ